MRQHEVREIPSLSSMFIFFCTRSEFCSAESLSRNQGEELATVFEITAYYMSNSQSAYLQIWSLVLIFLKK